MTKSLLRRGAVALSASLVLAAPAATPATAAPSPKPARFALAPDSGMPSLMLRGTPGTTLRGAVRVRNLSDRAITVRLRPADIRNASNGNADFVLPRPSGSGRWLRLAAGSVRLAPGASRRVAFTVSIPASARGASHYAGIVAVDPADPSTAADRRRAKRKDGFSFDRINRQALPLTIRLPGPLTRRLRLRSLELDIQPSGAAVLLGLLPSGTELIQNARVRLRVLRGDKTVFAYSSSMGQLFPGERLNYRVPWKGRPTRGSYRVVGTIRPHRASVLVVDQKIDFTPAAEAKLDRSATPSAQSVPPPALPMWLWFTLAGGGVLLLSLLVAVLKLKRGHARLAG